MYTSLKRDSPDEFKPSTKYTEYLKTFDDQLYLDHRHRRPSRRQQNPLHSLSTNEVKFSKIFSPTESNALKLQLLQKTASLPLLDPDSNNNGSELINGASVENVGDTNRRSSTGVVHATTQPTRRTKGESVTNLLYSTIRNGREYDNPSTDETLHTGSDSKVDYDPHEPLPAVDQIALRHELLNNIRAISRATYFEDLYTGKVRRNSGSPEEEILRLLENPEAIPEEVVKNVRTIPSKDSNLSRVDRWVKESSVASSRNTDTDEEKETIKNASLYHNSMWKEEKQGGVKKKVGRPEESSYTTESEVDEYRRSHQSSFKTTKFSKPKEPVDKRRDKSGEDSQYVQPKYLGVDAERGKRRPFSFGLSSNSEIPLSVSLPNVGPNSYHSTPVVHDTFSIKSHSTSRPELNYSSVVAPKARKKRELNPPTNNTEQVRRLPHKAQPKPVQRRLNARYTIPDKVPSIYSRLNINQWVLKKILFYVNGDEHVPRFEYRFRHGKDIRDMDQLLDILTKRFPTLPTGARHIFTMDGYLIKSLEELVNENEYVVSSTKKFKAIKYGSKEEESENKKNIILNSHQPLNQRLSASDGNISSRTVKGNVNKFQSQKFTKSVSDVPKLVAHVIEEAAVQTQTPNTRQPIRVINGLRPSLQSQVLLNTRTSQPFEELIRDLALSVRIPKQPIGNILQTLAGRQIRSYSQLRSELKAGQRTFYVYSDNIGVIRNQVLTYQKQVNGDSSRKPTAKTALGQVDSNSSSDLSVDLEREVKRKPHSNNYRRTHSDMLSPNSRFAVSRSPTPQA